MAKLEDLVPSKLDTSWSVWHKRRRFFITELTPGSDKAGPVATMPKADAEATAAHMNEHCKPAYDKGSDCDPTGCWEARAVIKEDQDRQRILDLAQAYTDKYGDVVRVRFVPMPKPLFPVQHQPERKVFGAAVKPRTERGK